MPLTLHGFYFKIDLQQRESAGKSINFYLATSNESSKAITRQYKKNATGKLIVKGTRSPPVLCKPDGMHTKKWLKRAGIHHKTRSVFIISTAMQQRHVTRAGFFFSPLRCM